MRRLLLALALAATLAVAAVPAALAADPTPAAPAVPSPADGVQEPTPTPAGPYDGTIVVDPTFVSGGELPTQPATAPATPSPRITPPPTDASVSATASDAGSRLPWLLLVLAASAMVALLASPSPDARRSRSGERA